MHPDSRPMYSYRTKWQLESKNVNDGQSKKIASLIEMENTMNADAL